MNNDRITELYEGAIGPTASQRRARTRVHWLCARARGDTILDVGCSQGIASILLAREGKRVFGVDVEEDVLRFARERRDQEEQHVAERLTFTFAEGGDLPYEDGTFDTVLLGEVIEHQIDPSPLLAEARRVLRKDGILVLTTPYGIFRYPDHKEPLYLRRVLELLSEGFAVEHVELMDKWLGVVARRAKAGEPAMQVETWRMAFAAAEQRLIELDESAEQRAETLKGVQSKLAEAREERDALQEDARRAATADEAVASLASTREQLAEARGAHLAARRELELVGARLEELERRERDAHDARLDAERRAAVTEGRHEISTAELARQLERADSAESRLLDAERRAAELEAQGERRDATRRAMEEEVVSLERQLALAGERLQAGYLEADAARARIAHLEARERQDDDDRAAGEEQAGRLEGTVARLEVELEAAREREAGLVRRLEAAQEREAAVRQDLDAARASFGDPLPPAAEPAPPVAPGPPESVTGLGPGSRPGATGEAAPPSPAPAVEPSLGVLTLEDETASPNGGASARTLAALARERYAEGDHGAAAEAYRQAAELEPRKGTHWLGLARTMRSLKRHEEALEAAQRALEVRPGWRDALWIALGSNSRLERTRDFEAAAAELGDLGKLAPKDLERLAPLALRAGAHRLALDVADRLLAVDAGSRAGVEMAAAARWELGDEAGATRLIDEALATGGQAGVRAALAFARHTDRLDPVPELVGRLEPPDRELMGRAAQTFLRRGDPHAALQVLDRLDAVWPGDPELAAERRRAEQQLRLHDGTWAPPRTPRRIETVPGRVLHLVSHSLPHHTSGGTYRTHYIARAQRAAGLDPHLVTQIGFPWFEGNDDAEVTDVIDGIPYLRLVDDLPDDPAPDARLRRALEQLIPLVERLRPAVLHPASDYLNAMLALELREIFGIPVVYEVRGFPEDRLVRRPGSRVLNDPSVGRRALEVKAMLAADQIVTLAEVMRRHMKSRGVDEGKVHIVPNGVDPGTLQPVHRDDAFARQLGIADDETVLGYVSTFHGYEGIQFIIEAVAELRRRGRRARALLVGDGRERDYLERRARELGVTDAVIFTGRVPHDEVLTYYGIIDLFVVPRRDEATSELVTPLKPFEAMGVERAVIVSDLGALREVVREGVTGRTFRPEDSQHLADVAEELIDDPELRRRLARAAYEWVTSERTWESNGERYLELYRGIGVV